MFGNAPHDIRSHRATVRAGRHRASRRPRRRRPPHPNVHGALAFAAVAMATLGILYVIDWWAIRPAPDAGYHVPPAASPYTIAPAGDRPPLTIWLPARPAAPTTAARRRPPASIPPLAPRPAAPVAAQPPTTPSPATSPTPTATTPPALAPSPPPPHPTPSSTCPKDGPQWHPT
jgi:hypothetical protein